MREVIQPGDADFQADRVLHVIRDLEEIWVDENTPEKTPGIRTNIHGSGTGNN